MCRELWNIGWFCEWCWWDFWKFYKNHLKKIQILFQIFLFGYNFIILKSDIIHELKFYKSKMRLDKQWTPIECKIVEIQIGSNLSDIITRVQFPIQLTTAWTIHCSQGLILDHLTFDLIDMTKHGLTCIIVSKVCSKKKMYLLFLFLIKFFQVDHFVQKEMFWLWTNAQYKLVIVSLKSYYSEFLIPKSFNTHFLTLDFENVLVDPNLLASLIFCLNETKIRDVHLNSKIYIALSQKFHISSCYDEHGIMVLYDDNVHWQKTQ
jgi:hypothetical protein